MPRAVIPFGIAFLAALSLTVMGTSLSAQAAEGGDTHLITLTASALPSGQLAYQMASHKVKTAQGAEVDRTDRYYAGPTIPGPTIVIKEGDTAEVTLQHGVADFPTTREHPRPWRALQGRQR